LGADLLWRDLRVKRFSAATPALFLDRDGVIIEEKEYISDPEDAHLLDCIADLIGTARKSGMAVVEVTNQAGIGRGYFGWAEFVSIENRVTQLLAGAGVSVDAVFACPFHSEALPPYQHPDHPWRKPNSGMLLEAASRLNLELSRSVLVGDKIADQEAARDARLAAGIHVLTGHGKDHEARVRAFSSQSFPVSIAASAREAASIIGRMGRTAPAEIQNTVLPRSS